jgi:hypothetical protein
MDVNEVFSKQQTVKTKYNGVDVFHHLRQPTNQEDLEFRRQSANVKVKNGRIQTSDAALDAPIQLYDKICQKVEMVNGAGPQEVADFKNLIPRDLKLAVIAAYQNRVEIDDQESVGNS